MIAWKWLTTGPEDRCGWNLITQKRRWSNGRNWIYWKEINYTVRFQRMERKTKAVKNKHESFNKLKGNELSNFLLSCNYGQTQRQDYLGVLLKLSPSCWGKKRVSSPLATITLHWCFWKPQVSFFHAEPPHFSCILRISPALGFYRFIVLTLQYEVILLICCFNSSLLGFTWQTTTHDPVSYLDKLENSLFPSSCGKLSPILMLPLTSFMTYWSASVQWVSWLQKLSQSLVVVL